MRTLYNASNAVEAQILKDVLGQEGVEAVVLGAHLQGAVGELPPGSLVRLVVDDGSWDAGRAIVARWERGDLGHFLDDDGTSEPE
jgi:hypothetical protein